MNGPSRDLCNLYNDQMEAIVIVSAAVRKLLSREEIPDDIYDTIDQTRKVL